MEHAKNIQAHYHHMVMAWMVKNFFSPDDNTPAYDYYDEEQGTIYQVFIQDNKRHRLNGPALILPTGKEEYWLYGNKYENIHDWLKDHPNPNLYFHKIGVFTEADKILWFLQN
jgi:hypothetical protein